MITVDGCRKRRERFWQQAGLPAEIQLVLLADPCHVRYFANCYVTPISYSADLLPVLMMARDGSSRLYHDNKMPATVQRAHVDDHLTYQWYDGQSPAACPRQLGVFEGFSDPPHDSPQSPWFGPITTVITEMRRRKDPDEVETLRACCRAGEAGMAWAQTNLSAGMTELDAYSGVCAACTRVVGEPVVVYGDFAVSPGPERRGGPPTRKVLADGDLMIFDYSVVIAGYRSDFTNTICVGGEPTSDQQRLMQLCKGAMFAGEHALRAGTACQVVYNAVRGVFEKASVADYFPHHAGHGLGLMHPEAPYIVRHSTETLVAGDVVTLEPGLYIPGVGGMRIEHNYLITDTGYEQLSQHHIGLC